MRWTSLGSALVVVGWIGQTLIFGAYVRSVADFRTPVGSLEVFIFLATYFYVAAIILLVAMELDELVRADLQRPRNRQVLLPLVAGVLAGLGPGELGDERPGVERLEAEPACDVLGRGPRALGEQPAQDLSRRAAPPPVLADLAA